MIALIENGVVVKFLDKALEDIPEHKRAQFLPVEEDRPPAAEGLEWHTSHEIVVEPSRVVRRYTVERRSADEQRQAVKDEAQRRIIAMTGATDIISAMIKQSNANMRANELNDKRLSGQELTAEEMAESAALRSFATAIKAIRARSNEIEAMDPIPSDYRADARWS